MFFNNHKNIKERLQGKNKIHYKDKIYFIRKLGLFYIYCDDDTKISYKEYEDYLYDLRTSSLDSPKGE